MEGGVNKGRDRVRDIREWREELTKVGTGSGIHFLKPIKVQSYSINILSIFVLKERDKIGEEIDHLIESRRHLDYAAQQSKRPLKVCQDCLTAREERVGIDQVS